MTKKDFELLASELADSAWRLMGEAGRNEIMAHYRYCAVIGLACRRTNERFDAQKWIRASVPESWRMEQHEDFTYYAVQAIEAKSIRVWDDAWKRTTETIS